MSFDIDKCKIEIYLAETGSRLYINLGEQLFWLLIKLANPWWFSSFYTSGDSFLSIHSLSW